MRRDSVIPFERTPTKPIPVVARSERIYAIGDIHGRLDLLVLLMAKITADAAQFEDDRKVKLVFLGDYIDRGEDSRQVLDALTRMAEFKSSRLVFLRGNHEDALRYFLFAPTEGAEWFDFGGLQTLGSFGIRPPQLRFGRRDLFRVRSELANAISAYEALFDAMVNSHRSGDVFFTHAGVDPSKDLEEQSPRALMWGHSEAQQPDPISGIRVVHGHYDADDVVAEPGRICVDTGAYYSGRLTAVRLDDRDAFLSTSAP